MYIAEEDYTAVSGYLLTFSSTVSMIDIPVTIAKDSIVEGDHVFFGNLRKPVGTVTLTPTQATVTIEDEGKVPPAGARTCYLLD